MRAFIAIELPETVQAVLSDIQHDLKKADADIRWVRPGNIHLTLKFLGTIRESMVRTITDVLQTASEKHKEFMLTLAGLGVFPNMRSPRVVWVGTRDTDTLTALQRDIEAGLEPLGFEREKRNFTAHLTLGRFKSARGKEAVTGLIEQYGDRELGAFHVRSIALMKSDLGPAGAKYTRITEVRLGDSGHQTANQ